MHIRAAYYLPHCSQKALGVKEASHPEAVGSATENPGGELAVPF